jgi:hypothetical protein
MIGFCTENNERKARRIVKRKSVEIKSDDQSLTFRLVRRTMLLLPGAGRKDKVSGRRWQATQNKDLPSDD